MGDGSEKLLAIHGIDWDKAYTNMPDDGLMRDVLGTFAEAAEMEASELESLYESGVEAEDDEALSLYMTKVHAMKHSAALFGADELSENAKALEFAARAQNRDFIRDSHSPFISEYRRLAEEIGDALGLDTSSGQNPPDNEELIRLTDMMEKAMETFDTITLTDLSFELSKYAFEPGPLKDSVGRLLDAARDFDIELLKTAAGEIRDQIRGSGDSL